MRAISSWLFFTFLFLLPWQTRWIWQQGEINGAPWEYGTFSIYGTEILLWLAIILFIINFFLKNGFRKRELLNCYIVKLLVVLLVSVLIIMGIVWNSQSWEISYQFIFRLLEGLAVVSIFVIFGATKNPLNLDFKGSFVALRACPERSEGMTMALWLGGVAQGLFAFGQFLLQTVPANKWLGLASHAPQDLGASVVEFGGERWLRAYGSFGSPNSLGIYLAVCLVVGLILILSLRGSERRGNPLEAERLLRHRLWFVLAMTAGQVIITTGLVLSFSRTAWLSALVGIIFLGLFLWKEKSKERIREYFKQLLFIVLPIICLMAIFFPIFFARFNLDNRLEAKSVGERSGQYTEWVAIFKSHPWFGVGPGAYTLALAEKNPSVSTYDLQPVHNIFLLSLVELGIFAWLSLFFILSYLIYKIYRLQPVFLAVIVALFVSGFTDHWLWSMYTGMMLWWVVLALGIRHRLDY